MDKMMDKTKCLPLSRWVRHAGRGLILASPMYCGAVLAAETPPAAKDSHAGHHQHGQRAATSSGSVVAAPEGMMIEIVEPATEGPVEAGSTLPVRIRAEGMSASGDHWHIYLNGELQAMVGAGKTEYELAVPEDLEPGEHEIKVTISNASHQEYDLAAVRTIQVQAPVPSTTSAPDS